MDKRQIVERAWRRLAEELSAWKISLSDLPPRVRVSLVRDVVEHDDPCLTAASLEKVLRGRSFAVNSLDNEDDATAINALMISNLAFRRTGAILSIMPEFTGKYQSELSTQNVNAQSLTLEVEDAVDIFAEMPSEGRDRG